MKDLVFSIEIFVLVFIFVRSFCCCSFVCLLPSSSSLLCKLFSLNLFDRLFALFLFLGGMQKLGKGSEFRGKGGAKMGRDTCVC